MCFGQGTVEVTESGRTVIRYPGFTALQHEGGYPIAARIRKTDGDGKPLGRLEWATVSDGDLHWTHRQSNVGPPAGYTTERYREVPR